MDAIDTIDTIDAMDGPAPNDTASVELE